MIIIVRKWTDEERYALEKAYKNKIPIDNFDILKDKNNIQLSQAARQSGLSEKYPDFDYMVGKKFNKLTVIKKVGKKNNYYLYECECECGNHVVVDGGHLRSGNTKSCGCALLDAADKKVIDLTGNKYGILTVIGLDEENDYISPHGIHQKRWICQCQCGNIISVNGNCLKNGNTKSCGCNTLYLFRENRCHKNTYNLDGEFGVGYSSNGKEFYFDLDDYDLIKNYNWIVDQTGYVRTSSNNGEKNILMHRLIMKPENDKIYIDHIHMERKNDNRKSNLRMATKSQNGMNIPIRSNNSSGVTGVSFDKRLDKWHSYINKDGVRDNLGWFDNFEDAVATRKIAEEKYFRERSYDNSQAVIID